MDCNRNSWIHGDTLYNTLQINVTGGDMEHYRAHTHTQNALHKCVHKIDHIMQKCITPHTDNIYTQTHNSKWMLTTTTRMKVLTCSANAHNTSSSSSSVSIVRNKKKSFVWAEQPQHFCTEEITTALQVVHKTSFGPLHI